MFFCKLDKCASAFACFSVEVWLSHCNNDSGKVLLYKLSQKCLSFFVFNRSDTSFFISKHQSTFNAWLSSDFVISKIFLYFYCKSFSIRIVFTIHFLSVQLWKTNIYVQNVIKNRVGFFEFLSVKFCFSSSGVKMKLTKSWNFQDFFL